MNIQLCRPAVTDPHKVRPCNYRIVALPLYEYLLKYSFYTKSTFGELCYIYPPQNSQY